MKTNKQVKRAGKKMMKDVKEEVPKAASGMVKKLKKMSKNLIKEF